MKSFCANTENPTVLLARLTGFLESGIVRPEWCFAAIDPYGEIVARHFWWLRSGSTVPFGIDFVSSEDHTAAVALILHAREQLAVDVAFCQITMPTEIGDNPSHVLADLVAVLNDSKFSFEVARVTVEWTSDKTIPLEGDRLTYRPACDLDDVLLNALFQSVADSSLDNGMVAERARVGIEEEARERLRTVRSYPGEREWFTVAFDVHDSPVGYVVPAYAADIPIIGEIGVAQPHRGHGLVGDLLSWGTRRLAESGAHRIVADTDRANAPMRAAFAKGGYRESRWRDDYLWHRQRPA
jgi:RimJ/RimL family protein N-acetyltransferase